MTIQDTLQTLRPLQSIYVKQGRVDGVWKNIATVTVATDNGDGETLWTRVYDMRTKELISENSNCSEELGALFAEYLDVDTIVFDAINQMILGVSNQEYLTHSKHDEFGDCVFYTTFEV